jgi:methyl-accepting chemotaxis protein
VGGLGITAVRTNEVGLNGYADTSREANLAGRVQANLILARVEVKNFLLRRDTAAIESFDKRWTSLETFTQEALGEIDSPGRKALLVDVSSGMETYEKAFLEAARLTQDADQIVQDIAMIAEGAEATLTVIVDAANGVDGGLAVAAANVRRDLLGSRMRVLKYLDEQKPETEGRARAQLQSLERNFATLEAAMGRDAEQLASVREGVQGYEAGFDKLAQALDQRNVLVRDTLDVLGPRMADDIEKVKLSVIEEQEALAESLTHQNARLLASMIGMVVVAMVVGSLLSLFTLRHLRKVLDKVITGIREGAEQVASAANQMTGASQGLAQSAAEEAATLEETSSSLEEMSSMTRQNAEGSRHANELVQSSRANMERSVSAMHNLSESMSQIEEASRQTQNIIKTIDEIAFQTTSWRSTRRSRPPGPGRRAQVSRWWPTRCATSQSAPPTAARSTTQIIEGTMTRVATGTRLVNELTEGFGLVEKDSATISTLIRRFPPPPRSRPTASSRSTSRPRSWTRRSRAMRPTRRRPRHRPRSSMRRRSPCTAT